mmetsp:Transcript_54513/g.165076  ORF Transcript_54513/g.165076 Transcript_54513/m.165076 type:complete len:215 (+) Transcript_54513:627-1271(+)
MVSSGPCGPSSWAATSQTHSSTFCSAAAPRISPATCRSCCRKTLTCWPSITTWTPALWSLSVLDSPCAASAFSTSGMRARSGCAAACLAQACRCTLRANGLWPTATRSRCSCTAARPVAACKPSCLRRMGSQVAASTADLAAVSTAARTSDSLSARRTSRASTALRTPTKPTSTAAAAPAHPAPASAMLLRHKDRGYRSKLSPPKWLEPKWLRT